MKEKYNNLQKFIEDQNRIFLLVSSSSNVYLAYRSSDTLHIG